MQHYLVVLLSVVVVTLVTIEQAAAGYVITICDGHRAGITCRQNKVIEIQISFYGRQNDYICTFHPSHQVPKGGCSASSALSVTKAKCDGKQACNIGPGGDYGDPCYGTFKYMTVSWKCVDSSTISKTICDDQRADLKCYQNKVIEIQSSFYGRQNNYICTNHPSHQVPKGGCSAPTAVNVARAECDGKQACTIGPADYSDPCYGTSKYLTVSWKCGDIQSKTVCDGETANLNCSQNEVIKIHSNFYGRQNNYICTSHPSHYVPRGGCSALTALSVAREKCDGKQACNIGPGMFGDPCFGTFKYLTVSWTCT